MQLVITVYFVDLLKVGRFCSLKFENPNLQRATIELADLAVGAAQNRENPIRQTFFGASANYQ